MKLLLITEEPTVQFNSKTKADWYSSTDELEIYAYITYQSSTISKLLTRDFFSFLNQSVLKVALVKETLLNDASFTCQCIKYTRSQKELHFGSLKLERKILMR